MYRIVPLSLAAAAGLVGLLACTDRITDPQESRGFVANLSAAPGVTSSATGTAQFVVRPNSRVDFVLNGTNLTGVTAAHIHNGTNAAIVVPLFADASGTGSVNGEFANGFFTSANVVGNGGMTFDQMIDGFDSGDTFVMVHTNAFADGELRGTITRSP